MKEIITILGVQSSGKTTQGKLLAKHLNYAFISTGALLRKLKKESNPIGKKLSEYWVKGEMVPDELIEEVLFPVLEKDQHPGVVLDGYPRNDKQLNSFLAFIDMQGWVLNHAFYIDVSEQEAITRIKKRAEEEKRADETAEAIQKRIALYHEQTEPLINLYQKLGKLHKINGERTIEEIHQDIKNHL